jgi:hypothetical protein
VLGPRWEAAFRDVRNAVFAYLPGWTTCCSTAVEFDALLDTPWVLPTSGERRIFQPALPEAPGLT